ncbi:MAG: Succinyl-CoA ligase [ADP-forming] alpha chain, partial [uncultured Nocardioidaceae bacterium]
GHLLDEGQHHRGAGHDRLGGPEAHPTHARGRFAGRRRRQRAQGGPRGRLRRDLVAGLRHGRRGHGRDRCRRLRGLRAACPHQGRGPRGDRGGHAAAGGHHRGGAGARHRRVPRRRTGERQHPHHRTQLPRPAVAGCRERRHHPRRHHRCRPDRPGLQVGHAD